MRVIVATWLACLAFALYNAYGIKGLESTWQWHVLQYASVLLFIFSGIEYPVRKLIRDLRNNDWHEFGETAAWLLLVVAVAISLYVFGLHYFLENIEFLL